MRDRTDVAISDIDLDAVVQVLESAPVTVGILYGSHARGEQTERSDVDVAVDFPESLPSLERTHARLALVEVLSEVLGTDRVDVVPLDTAPPTLVDEIRTDGVRLVGPADALTGHGEESSTPRSREERRTAFDDVLTDLERVV